MRKRMIRWFDLPACILMGLVIGGYIYGMVPCLYDGGDIVPCLSRGSDGVVVAFEGLFEWTTLPDLLMVYLVVGSSVASCLAIITSRCMLLISRRDGGSAWHLRKLIIQWFDLPACILMGLVVGGYIYGAAPCLDSGGETEACAGWGIVGAATSFQVALVWTTVPDRLMVNLVFGSFVASYLATVMFRCGRRCVRRTDQRKGAVDVLPDGIGRPQRTTPSRLAGR